MRTPARPQFKTSETWLASKRLTKTLFNTWRFGSIMLLCLIAVDRLIPVLISRVQGNLIDELVTAHSNKVVQGLLVVFSVYLLLLFVSYLTGIINNYFSRISADKLSNAFRNELILQYRKLDPADYSQPKFHNLLHRVNESTPGRLLNFSYSFQDIVAGILSLIFLSGAFLSLSPIFILIIFLSALPEGFVRVQHQRRDWKEWKEDTEKRRHLRRLENYLGREELTEAKINNFVEFMHRKWGKILLYLFERDLNREKARDLSYIFARFLSLVLFGAAAYLLIHNYLQGIITLGQFTFYFSLIPQLSGAIGRISSSLTSMGETTHYVNEFYEVCDYEPLLSDGEKKLDSSEPVNIEFRNVWFKYPEQKRFVLKDVSFELPAGGSLALVGENGAGKSTIVKLLCRFYDVTKGEILINGEDIKSYKKESLGKYISLLSQDFGRYYFDARTNIALGDIERRKDLMGIKKAAKLGGADSVIESFPEGYNQILDKSFEGGIEPSVGQWQRIALSRSLFKDAPFVVLDEPTSAVDPSTEYNILKRLFAKFEGNHSLLIVSHRFSTVRNADQILVLEKGVIIEHGTHPELLRMDGTYATAYGKQKEGYTDTASK